MTYPVGSTSIISAAGGNVQLQRVLQEMRDEISNLSRSSANPLGASLPSSVAPVISPFTVVGSQGKFIIDIVPPQLIVYPSQAQRLLAGARLNFSTDAPDTPEPPAVYFQLRAADDELITTNVNVYDIGTVLHFELLAPNSFKFWQLRSKYATSPWTAWQPYIDPAVCGPVQVWSGLITSSSTSLVNQGSSYVGSSPLTQSGTSTQINVAATTWRAGDQNLQYNAGSVDPGSYGLFYVYADDPARKGGAVIYVATANIADLTALDGRLYFGQITTSGGGGGTGGGGGSGACVSGESLITMWDGSKRAQKELWRGDRVLGIGGEIETVTDVVIHAGVPCFVNELENGIVTQPFSSRHPVKFANGGFGLNFDLLPGEPILTERGPSALKRKTFAGLMTVYAMLLNRSFTFWADGVGSHNANYSGK